MPVIHDSARLRDRVEKPAAIRSSLCFRQVALNLLSVRRFLAPFHGRIDAVIGQPAVCLSYNHGAFYGHRDRAKAWVV
jgi:hypothetical protein